MTSLDLICEMYSSSSINFQYFFSYFYNYEVNKMTSAGVESIQSIESISLQKDGKEGPRPLFERRKMPKLALPEAKAPKKTSSELYKSTIHSTVTNLFQFKIQEHKFANIVKDIDNNKELFFPKQAKVLFGGKDAYKDLLAKLIGANEKNLKALSSFSPEYGKHSKAILEDPEIKEAAKELAKYENSKGPKPKL